MRARSLLWSFNYAIEGMAYALRTQRNMRLHVLAAVGVLIAAVVLQVSRLEMIALLFAIALVIVAELVNTAVEATVDVAMEGFDPTAKIAKDVAAGAVLVASLAAVAVGYVVFFDRFRVIAEDGLVVVRRAPVHVTIVAITLTAIAVLAIKAFTEGGTWLKGGWPSGHAAVAVAAASAIGYVTNNAKAAVLALFIAALVAQSRVESETHTIPQVLLGGLIGFLIATAVFQIFWA